MPGVSCELLAGLACSWMMLRYSSQGSERCGLEGLQLILKSQGSTWLHPSHGHPAICQALGLCSTGSSHCQLGSTQHGASSASAGGERGSSWAMPCTAAPVPPSLSAVSHIAKPSLTVPKPGAAPNDSLQPAPHVLQVLWVVAGGWQIYPLRDNRIKSLLLKWVI